MAKAIQARHPGVELTILSQSSIEILRHLEDFTIDVGFTYLDNEPVEGMRAEPIYMERYCLLVRADHELADGAVGDVGRGRQAAAVPADARHAEPAHHRPRVPRRQRQPDPAPRDQLGDQPVRQRAPDGHGQRHSRVLPEVLGPMSDIRTVPLVEPLVEHSVGLVAVDRDPVSPLVLAAFECAKAIEPPSGGSVLGGVNRRRCRGRSSDRPLEGECAYFAGAGASPWRKRPTYAAFATILPCIAFSRSSRLAVAGRSRLALSA